MAKLIKLTEPQAKKITLPGRHCVDSSCKVYIDIKPSGHRTWVVRLGTSWKKIADVDRMSLSNVRLVLSRERHDLETATFQKAAEKYISLKSDSWKGIKSLVQWQRSLAVYAYPSIGKLPCDQVRHGHILKVAAPIWKAKPETCRRVVQRISAVLAFEHRRLHLPFIDPTDGLSLTLGKQAVALAHHPAPTVAGLKAALALFAGDCPTHRCFRFMVYTIARSGEARNATGGEMADGVWTVPGEKMKSGKPHRVPLTQEALACLGQGDGLLFPNKGRPLSDMAISMLLRKAQLPFVPHGIRSCFRSWCAETGVDFAVAELCLAHTPKDAVVRAYQRSDLLDKRRAALEAWASALR